MAQDSKHVRRDRRARRYVSLMERDSRRTQQEMKQIQQQLFNTNLMLLCVLSQAGGEATVTQGTFQQVVEQGARIGWQSGLGPTVEGQTPEFIIRVISTEQTVPESSVGDTVSTIGDTYAPQV